ncbi:SDR family NAD(P)-dependent oxidoreductase [Dactylosporangium sp. NPDC049742]|uniref:SDR family NAD(P)-dependent oxidoreductase n=1 Tax=Dactylosporangium sp. NPDC049742 TaxID=3154737 RepID=UPI00344A3143
MSRSQLERRLTEELAARLHVPVDQIDPTCPVATYGLPSVEMVGLVGELEAMVGRELPSTLIWEHPTIEAVAAFLAAEPADPAGPVEPSGPAARHGRGTAPGTAAEPVAVIGIGCRFPGADGPDRFWRLLHDGRDAITEVPPDRWSVADFVDPDPAAPGKTTTRWGGFLDGVDRFDPQFFGISPREAERMDPQQRLLAEVAWEALDDAGLVADDLAGSATGVFVGIATNDYALLQLDDYARIDAHYGTGNAASIAANRLSYLLDLHGPSMAVDTACSSSLVAVQQACASLAAGDCTLALAGGVNVILSPALAINFSKAGAMAADGRCKSFDARADGYVRSEGAGVVVLKPLSRAVADRDTIYGVVLGGAVNQDGRTNGLMAPNPAAQEAVLRAAYANAAVPPAAVGYVETHGTGTLLGDPIEAKALAAVIGRDRDPDRPCIIGSVKSNIGHLEAAAGVAGLIKALLAVRHRTIPASLHYEQPNPHIPFQELGLRVAAAAQPWPVDGPAVAGVSSFGFGGTNVHLVVGAAPAATTVPAGDESEPATQLLTVSARTSAALRDLAARYDEQLGEAAGTVQSLCAAAALRRTHYEHRLACVGGSAQELRAALAAFARAEERPGLSWGARRVGRRPRPVFVFTGQGARWWPLGADLLQASPVLSDVLERCDATLRDLAGWSLLEQLSAGTRSRLAEPAVAQPALVAVQIALAEQWRSWGVEPAAVVGHSVGEISAAYVAGALDLADALRVAMHRGQVIGRAGGGGGMAAVGLSLQQTRELLDRLGPDAVWVAASNAPTSTVLSGDAEQLDRVVAALDADGIFARRLESVTFASHSPVMAPLSAELEHRIEGLRARPATIPMWSTATGAPVGSDRLDAGYWAQNLRRPVLFDPVIAELRACGHDTFVEVSPHPMLQEALRERLALAAQDDTDVAGAVVASIRRERDVRAELLAELGRLYCAGFPVDWHRVHGPATAMVGLPAYPWQRERYWLQDAAVRPRRAAGEHPLLRGHLLAADEPKAHHWSARVDLAELPYLRDHQVRGIAVLPAAAVLDAALVAARRVLGDDAVTLHDVEFVRMAAVAEHAATETLQLVLTPEAGTGGSFELFDRDGDAGGTAWSPLAKGAYGAAPEGTPTGDLDAARARCTGAQDVAAHYAGLSAAGLEYDGAFRGIDELWHAPGEAVARLRVPAGPAAGDDPYAVHPAVLDSCLQVLAAAAGIGGPDTYVPVAVRCCSLAAGRVRPRWVSASVTGTATSPGATFTGRVVLFDDTGSWAGEVDGVLLRRLDGTGDDGPAGTTFDVRWAEAAPDAAAGLLEADGRWLVLADAGGFADGVAAALTARGASCVTVRAGRSLRRLDASRFEADPGSREDLAALCRQLRDGSADAWRGVVHGWALDAALDDRLDAAGTALRLPAVEDLGCGSVLHLVQELAAGGLGGVSRLLLLTRGAQRATDDDGVPSVAQSALWGLARVIALEHGELHPAIVDLDPLPAGNETDQVVAEALRAHPGQRDGQVCLRAGRRLHPALVRRAADGHGPAADGAADRRPFDEAADGNFHVVAGASGLSGLLPSRCDRRPPGPGEIQIRVHAAGLNFSDVLKAIGLYPGVSAAPGGVALGAECAGEVAVVGAGVEGYRPGDLVMAVAAGSFAAYTTTAAHLVVHRPVGLSHEQAAACPIAFLTALHALEHLARLRPGERVLIHSAAGGVGLAALQVAARAGAEVYATAGTEAKRDLLRSLGVRHVMDSRSLRFAEEIMRDTGGRGVDVVLNSLGGAALRRSIAVLAPGGRFVELGKQDIYANSHLGLELFKRNRSFFAVDLEACFADEPAHVAELFLRLGDGLASGAFTAPRSTVFGLSEAATAGTMMMRAGHIGKLVLRRTGQETVPATHGRMPVRHDATYLVTGGLGALGRRTARYLAGRGAGHIVLMSRSEPAAAVLADLDELRAGGTGVTVFRGDAARAADVAAVMDLIDRDLPALRGVVHAAGVLDDGLLSGLDRRRLRAVLAPKVDGGWHLHRATMARELDCFVLYSSAAALVGSPGQGNYAAANAFLDGLAAYRRACGLPALSIDWGPWSEEGLAARPDRAGQLAESGIAGIASRDGVAALDAVLGSGAAQVVVLTLDRPRLRAAAALGLLPQLLADLAGGPQAAGAAAAAGRSAEIRDRLLAVEPGRRRRDILTSHLRQTIAQVLQLDPADVDDDAPLAGLGFDSLMSLDLRKRLEATLGVELPATLAWRYPTVAAIVPFLAERMGVALTHPDGTPAQPSAGTAREAADQAPAGTDETDSGSAPPVALDDAPDHADIDDLDIEALLLAKMTDIDALDDTRWEGRAS